MSPAALPEGHRIQLESLAPTYWWHGHRVRSAAEALRRFAKKPAGSYVDAGCGGGTTTRLLADELMVRGLLAGSAPILGVDADARCAKDCAVPFMLADLSEDAPSGRYELFSCLDVLEHVAEPKRFLANLRRLLAADALGIVTVPAFDALFCEYDRQLGHLRRYDDERLRADLRGAGFQTLWSSYLFSFAAPAAPLRRAPSFPSVPRWANAALKTACAAERAVMKVGRVPFGTSLLAVVKLLS